MLFVVLVIGMYALPIAGEVVARRYLEQGRALPLYSRVFLGWAAFVGNVRWLLVPLTAAVLLALAIFTKQARSRN